MRMLEAPLMDAMHISCCYQPPHPPAAVRSRLKLLSGSAAVLTLCRCSMWAHMTLFYASGPDLAVAWSYIAAAQPLAQVGPAPVCTPPRPDVRDFSCDAVKWMQFLSSRYWVLSQVMGAPIATALLLTGACCRCMSPACSVLLM